MDKTPLPEPQPGEQITAEWAAELTRRAAEQGVTSETFGDDYSRAGDQKRKPNLPSPVWVLNGTGAEVPAWSIFGVAGNMTNTTLQEPAQIGGGETVNQGCLFGIFTNGPLALPNNVTAECYMLDGLGAFRVRVTTGVRVGYPCGPRPDEMDMAAEYTGFVCLTARDEETGTAMVCATALLETAYVEVVSAVSAATISNGVVTMGVGTGYLYYRKHADNTLHPLTDPIVGSSFAVFIIYNPFPVVVPTGYRTQVSARMGCGLCIEDVAFDDQMTYAIASSAGGDWTGSTSEEISFESTDSTLDGYIKFSKRVGSESWVGIAHEPGAAAPDPGNFVCNREGRFEITCSFRLRLRAGSTPITWGTQLTGVDIPDIDASSVGHKHEYNDYRPVINGPEVEIGILANTIHLLDEFGQAYTWVQSLPRWEAGFNGYRAWECAITRTMQIVAGQRFHFRVRVYGTSLNVLKLSLDTFSAQVSFRRVGDTAVVENTTGSI